MLIGGEDHPGPGQVDGVDRVQELVLRGGLVGQEVNVVDGQQFETAGSLAEPVDAVASDNSRMTWWENMPVNGKIIGSEKIGDKDCYIFETWDEEKKENKIKGWVDKTAFLLVQMESKGGKGETFKMVNSNFKKVKKWEIPYTIEVFTGGKLMTKTIIKTLNINKGLSDDLFDADKVKMEGKGVPGMPDMKEMMKKFKMGG